MHITFSPQRRDDELIMSKRGDVLAINGIVVDMSFIPDGGTMNAEDIGVEWIVGSVARIDGKLHLSVILPHAAGAPDYMCFPDPIVVTKDGAIDVPTWTAPDEAEDE